MSGVAPSGSSKTKARREREAAEQRRKLSEAMVKVVEAAGGDVRKLGELSAELPVVGLGVGEFHGGGNTGGNNGGGGGGEMSTGMKMMEMEFGGGGGGGGGGEHGNHDGYEGMMHGHGHGFGGNLS